MHGRTREHGHGELFTKYRTAEDYLKVPVEELAADIKPTGFFNQKTKSLRGACARIVEAYGGEVPNTMEDLITLPGVARKTANIVLGNSYGVVEGIAVDTHVRRVGERLGFTSEKDPDKIEQDLMRLIPRKRWFDFTGRDHRSRPGDVRGSQASVRRVSGERSVPVEPGVTLSLSGDDRRQRAPAPASELPPFVLVQATPHARVLRGDQRPFQAIVANAQPSHTALALAVWTETHDGGPMGKNSSGSSAMHFAPAIQVVWSGSCLNLRSIMWHRSGRSASGHADADTVAGRERGERSV